MGFEWANSMFFLLVICLCVLFAGFTRMVLSLWSVTMLSLYIRVQVNILGRHLYVDTARALDTSSHLLVRYVFSHLYLLFFFPVLI